jgi:hypothetical protein
MIVSLATIIAWYTALEFGLGAVLGGLASILKKRGS